MVSLGVRGFSVEALPAASSNATALCPAVDEKASRVAYISGELLTLLEKQPTGWAVLKTFEEIEWTNETRQPSVSLSEDGTLIACNILIRNNEYSTVTFAEKNSVWYEKFVDGGDLVSTSNTLTVTTDAENTLTMHGDIRTTDNVSDLSGETVKIVMSKGAEQKRENVTLTSDIEFTVVDHLSVPTRNFNSAMLFEGKVPDSGFELKGDIPDWSTFTESTIIVVAGGQEKEVTVSSSILPENQV